MSNVLGMISSTHLTASTNEHRSSSFMTGGPLYCWISSSGLTPTTNTSPSVRACKVCCHQTHPAIAQAAAAGGVGTYLPECVGVAIVHQIKAAIKVHADGSLTCKDSRHCRSRAIKPSTLQQTRDGTDTMRICSCQAYAHVQRCERTSTPL